MPGVVRSADRPVALLRVDAERRLEGRVVHDLGLHRFGVDLPVGLAFDFVVAEGRNNREVHHGSEPLTALIESTREGNVYQVREDAHGVILGLER